MYLSQVLLKNHPSIRWEQRLKPKSFIDYGQPVLIGFGAVPLNPVRVVLMLAYEFVRKERSGKLLRELYDIWSSMVAES